MAEEMKRKAVRKKRTPPQPAAEAAVPEQTVKPGLLIVDRQSVGFPLTRRGASTEQTISVVQHYADTPVSLTIDNPDAFSFVIPPDDRLLPAIGFVPTPVDTKLRIRFSPKESGTTTARLIIQTPYSRQQVDLTGRSPAPFTVKWRLLAGIGLGIAGLVAGYQNRCRISPVLCPDRQWPAAVEIQADTLLRELPQPVSTPGPDTLLRAEIAPVDTLTVAEAPPLPAPVMRQPPIVPGPGFVPVSVPKPSSGLPVMTPSPVELNQAERPKPAKPQSVTAESDLERALNGDIHH